VGRESFGVPNQYKKGDYARQNTNDSIPKSGGFSTLKLSDLFF
jgi:hypothetical protein